MLNECGSSHNLIDRALDRHSFGKSEKELSPGARVRGREGGGVPFSAFSSGNAGGRDGEPDLANGCRVRERAHDYEEEMANDVACVRCTEVNCD